MSKEPKAAKSAAGKKGSTKKPFKETAPASIDSAPANPVLVSEPAEGALPAMSFDDAVFSQQSPWTDESWDSAGVASSKKNEPTEPEKTKSDKEQVNANAKASAFIDEPLFGAEFQAEEERKAAKPYVMGPNTAAAKRKSGLHTSMSALTYINNLAKDDDVRIRDSDRTTSLLLFGSTVLMFMSLFLPVLAPHRFGFVLICDAMVGLMLLFYVFNRFGILNTLTPRQALLTWQLIMGGAFLGVFVTINLAVAIGVMVAQNALH